MPNFVGKKKKPRWNKYLKSSNFYKKRYLYHITNYSSFLYKWTYKWENIPSKLKKSELPLVGTKGILKVWVKGSSEADCEERGGRLRDEGEWFWCLSESVWGTKRLRVISWFGCLSESVWTLRDWECLRDWVYSGQIWVRRMK